MKSFRFKGAMMSLALCLCILSQANTYAYSGEVNQNNSNIEVTDQEYSKAFKEYSSDLKNGDISKYNGIVPCPYDVTLTKTGALDTFESKYDPRNLGIMTPVKNQGVNEVCWAFAGIGTLESYLKLKGYGEYDLSEEHLRWFATLKNGHGWNRTAGEGGPTQIVPGYLVSSNGPKLESDIPYSFYSSSRPSNMDTAKNVIDVSDIEYIADDRNSVKKAIKENGAVETCYYDNSNYLQGISYYYNTDSETKVNHSVVIVGWDDNYPKSNFKVGKQPKDDGAWLIKNSWGTNKYDNGYMWISYEDAVILKGKNGNLNYTIKNARPSDNIDRKKYQYDENGFITKCAFNDLDGKKFKEVYYMNVFDFDENYTDLESVMFDSESIGSSYSIYYDDVDEKGIPYTDEKNMQLLYSGTIDFSGYRTINIGDYKLKKGKGAIVIKVSNKDSDQGVSLGAESQVVYDNCDGKVAYISEANEGESFVMVNGDDGIILEDMNGENMKTAAKYSPRNFCIKVNAKKTIVHDYKTLEYLEDYNKYIDDMDKISDKNSIEYKNMLNFLTDKYNKLSDDDKNMMMSDLKSKIESVIDNTSKDKEHGDDEKPATNAQGGTSTATSAEDPATYDNNKLNITIIFLLLSVFTIYSFDKKKNMI